MMKSITSSVNPAIRKIASLRNSAKRRKLGLSIAEGKREVAKLLDSALVIEGIYFPEGMQDGLAQIINKAKESKVELFALKDRVFSKIAFGAREEVIAVFKPAYGTFDELPKRKKPFYVVVEQIEKPGNLGAILRTCDGAGVDGIIICDGRTDLYNPNVIRASLGAVFSQPIVLSSNAQALAFLKGRKIGIFAASPKAKTSYTNSDFDRSLAIVVGSEQEGLSSFWINKADNPIKIPMKGAVDSLNVSVSTAILLYEVLRQRTK